MALLAPTRTSLVPIIAGLRMREWVAPAMRYRIYAAPSCAIGGLGLVLAIATGSFALFAFAVVAGVIAAAAPAWAVLNARGDAALEAVRLRDELDLLADERVRMVVRQFEWAVADVERLRRTLKLTQTAKAAIETRLRETDRNARQLQWLLEQARAELAAASRVATFPAEVERSDAVELHWGLHDDGYVRWLQLEGGTHDVAPTMVRIVGPDGAIVALSGRATELRLDEGPVGIGGVLPRGVASLSMRVADEVVAALGQGDIDGLRVEANVDDTWRRVILTDTGSRTAELRDKRGRFYRS